MTPLKAVILILVLSGGAIVGVALLAEWCARKWEREGKDGMP